MDFLLIVRTFLCLLLTLHSSTPLYWPLACFPFPCALPKLGKRSKIPSWASVFPLVANA
jgi:hypothetical protein